MGLMSHQCIDTAGASQVFWVGHPALQNLCCRPGGLLSAPAPRPPGGCDHLLGYPGLEALSVIKSGRLLTDLSSTPVGSAEELKCFHVQVTSEARGQIKVWAGLVPSEACGGRVPCLPTGSGGLLVFGSPWLHQVLQSSCHLLLVMDP